MTARAGDGSGALRQHHTLIIVANDIVRTPSHHGVVAELRI
jgi:hypothetical protein